MSGIEAGTLAGIVSTTLFVASYLPMLYKAVRSRDLTSYSLGNLVIANVGNGVHTIYVLSLPPGPLWALHGFYLGSSALMLLWWWRFRSWERSPSDADRRTSVTAPMGGFLNGVESAFPLASQREREHLSVRQLREIGARYCDFGSADSSADHHNAHRGDGLIDQDRPVVRQPDRRDTAVFHAGQ